MNNIILIIRSESYKTAALQAEGRWFEPSSSHKSLVEMRGFFIEHVLHLLFIFTNKEQILYWFYKWFFSRTIKET